MRSLCIGLVGCFFLLVALPQIAQAEDAADVIVESVIVEPEQSAEDFAIAHDAALGETAAPLTVAPVPGKLSSEFGVRSDPVRRKRRQRARRKMHKGLDFIAQRGTLVHAAGSGVVLKAKVMGGYGRVVIVDHGAGVQTRYAHLQRIHVRAGQRVDAGKVVGKVGSSGRVTGPHLHFEVRLHGEAVQPRGIVQFKVPNCAKTARHCTTHKPKRAKRRKKPNT